MKITDEIFGILCYSFSKYFPLKNSSVQLYYVSIFWHFYNIQVCPTVGGGGLKIIWDWKVVQYVFLFLFGGFRWLIAICYIYIYANPWILEVSRVGWGVLFY